MTTIHDAPEHVRAILGRLERRGCMVKSSSSPSSWRSRCPVPTHNDRSLSLSISISEDDKVLLRCHAGCDWRQIIAALGIEPSNLWPRAERSQGEGESDPHRAIATLQPGPVKSENMPATRLQSGLQASATVQPHDDVPEGPGWRNHSNGYHRQSDGPYIREISDIRSADDTGKTGAGDNSQNSPISQVSYPKPPDNDAFYGLAGKIVRAIEPHTESDPVALLVQLLVAFGNAAGRYAYYKVEADWHYPVLFAVLVGNSSKGRKGTSWRHIRARMRSVDPDWERDHIATGLSSGEGLIHMLRDVPENDSSPEDEPLLLDKRLLMEQGEFASVLKMLTRDGNILSDILRQMWDGSTLGTLTKQSPERASRTHGSIVGHISREELLRYLTAIEAANGFGNRFLWACVQRSKVLPDGGEIDKVNFADLDRQLGEALVFAKAPYQTTREPSARDLWHQVYPDLSEGKPGLLGAMIARAEAQVTRLALIYALLDKSPIIKLVHLQAALALWRYCEASARYIFGDALGDPIADTIVQALRGTPGGMTRTEISSLFGRHLDATKLMAALKTLLCAHLARYEMVQTDGRAAEHWFAVMPSTDSAK